MPIIDRGSLPRRLEKDRNRMSKVLILAVILVAVLMVGALAGLIRQIGNGKEPLPSEAPLRIPARITYAMHDPILIDGNSEFTSPNASTGVTKGSGTASDPYVIEGWDIDASTGNGIEIRNADVYFVVRTCLIRGGWNGICLKNCANSALDSNICSGNGVYNGACGIRLDSSVGIALSNNICSNSNNGFGIYLYATSNSSITQNNCSSDFHGMILDNSNNNVLSDNNCSNNSNEGIHLVASGHNTLTNNTCVSSISLTYYGGVVLAVSNDNILANNICINSNNGFGINLCESSNNSLGNNNCSNNWIGIYLDSSNDNTFTNNNCSDNSIGMDLATSNNNLVWMNNCSNSDRGVHLYSSGHNTISNNNCSGNVNYGLYIDSSNYNTFTDNNCSLNDQYGIYLYYSGSNDLTNNTCSSNSYDGIYLRHSDNNVILLNTVKHNAGSAIGIYSGTNNRISYNIFIHNNGAGDTYDPLQVQAYDYGTVNWWNSTDGYGNCWSDWTTPDVAPPDGIVDVPYDVAGSAGAKDYYPLTTAQAPIPEFGTMPLVVIVFLAAIFLMAGARRRKAS